MKIIIISFISIFLFIGTSLGKEKKDCSKISKFSPKYYKCKASQLKPEKGKFTSKPDLSNLSEKKSIADIFKKKSD